MQLDKLTIKSQEALAEAQRLAHEYSHQAVDCEHLLLALIGQGESLVPELLEKIGVPVAKLQPDVEAELNRRHKVTGTSSSDVFASQELKKALDAAQSEAGKLKDDYISTEHLLLGILDAGGAALKEIFKTNGLKRDVEALVTLQKERYLETLQKNNANASASRERAVQFPRTPLQFLHASCG